MPPSIQRSNAKHYKSKNTLTEVKEYEGMAHLLPAQDGWEEVADYALEWAVQPRQSRRVTDIRVTHIGGPTMLIEVGGWRLLTDPTFDDPGRKYSFGWGTSSRKVAGPAIAAGELGPIDAILLTHDHHADNLDDAGRALLPAADIVVTTVAGAAATGRQRPRARAVGRHAARGARPAVDRHHGHTVPPRSAGEPFHRRRRDRLRPSMGRSGARRVVDLRRHGALRRRA